MSEGPGGPQGATAGGTLAMRMLSQQAMVASQMKRAANDKAIAQMLASKKSGPPAARLGDEIQHKSFLGALAGAVLGAIVTIAEGCLIMAACATGPYALVLVPALMYASYKASDYVEEKQNQLESWINSFCDTDGAINTGSENVKINGKPAARAAVTLPPPPPPGAIPEVPQGEPSWGDIATDLLESAAEKAVPLAKAWGNAVITLTDSNAGFMDRVSAGASLLFPAGPVLMEFATMVGGRGEIKKDVDFPEAGEDTALCDKENKPPRIAQGSSNVFINNQPAARQGDKLECSAAIVGGSPDVFIGGEQVTYLDIQPEFPPWQRMILGGITIASYLLPPAGLLGKLAYVNQRLDDMPATQHYARLVIDDIDNQALITPLTPEQNQQRFNFRRLHEEVGRRWTFSFDSSIGLRSGAMSTANNNVGGAAPGKSYRSYGQLEAEYRIGRNMLLEGDLLSVYSRVFADTGENGVMMPVKNPMSGTGLRWKPLRDQIFFLAVEQQLPLNGQNGASDTMLRASASFFNGGKYSDEWHPNGSGWFAQNLYLDAAQYIRQDIQAWTADYRVSWHQKVANGQTIEPYAHVQDNGYRDKGTQGAQLGGVGVRWNIWTGETHYDAWPHKVSLGVEYQHTFKAINQRNGERNNAFLTIGVHW